MHKVLKEKGPVKVPREFVFMDRAAIGLGGVFLHLGAKLNWHGFSTTRSRVSTSTTWPRGRRRRSQRPACRCRCNDLRLPTPRSAIKFGPAQKAAAPSKGRHEGRDNQLNEQAKRQTFFGACPHDCPDTCAMLYEVEDGKLVEVHGNKDSPMTRGGLCVKLKDFHDHHGNPDRLMYPMRRCGPKGSKQFERITWDEAISTIGQKLAEIIAKYGAPGDHATKLSRQHGARAGYQLRRSLFQSPRLDGERKDLLRIGLVDGLAADRTAQPAASIPRASYIASTS